MGYGHDNDAARDTKPDHTAGAHTKDAGAEPKPTNSAQADQMLAKRLTPSAPALDFGERIVGSTGVEQVQAPWNGATLPAVASFAVSGEGFELTSSSTMTIPYSGTMSGPELEYHSKGSPTIAFKPTRSGEQHGTLTITVGWGDGHVETQTVALRGRARSLEQAAAHDESSAELADEQQTQKRLSAEQSAEEKTAASDEKKKPVYDPAFDSAVEDAAHAAGRLARRQRDGVDLINEETKAYQKIVEKAPHSIWGDLLEVALTMATAGIAAHVAKVLLPKLLGTTVEKIEEMPIPGHPAETVTEFVPHKFSEFTTDFIKEGIKQAGKKAIGQVGTSGGKHGGDGHEEQNGSAPESSSNAKIDFFAQQWRILDAQEKDNHALVKSHARYARPLLRTHPQQAVATMQSLQASFDESGDVAEQEQANRLAPQWATLISRMSLGTEKTNTADGRHEQDALRTDALREHHGTGAPKPVDGVLDVYLDGAYTQPRLLGAKLHGISQEVADRLAGLPLANLPMPVRFVLGPTDANPIIITRDEAGRVRVSGSLNGTSREQDEVSSATALIDRFLSVPLKSTGVEIKSDDATGRT